MDRFLQGFKDLVIVYTFIGVLMVTGVPYIYIVIIATIVGTIVMITHKEANTLKGIIHGYQIATAKKIAHWHKKVQGVLATRKKN